MYEDNQVWAKRLDIPGDEYLYLEDGHAEELRDLAQTGQLACPLLGCPSPRFNIRNCHVSGRRDHFFHADGDPGHEPESLAHQIAKNALAAQLRRCLSDGWTVSVDDHALDNGQRPDVNVYRDGKLVVAVEIQYSPITPQEWTRRQQGYRDRGVCGIWFFGGGHTQHRSPNELQEAVLTDGSPLHFVRVNNDLSVELGTAGGRHVIDSLSRSEPMPAITSYEIAWSSINESDQVNGVPRPGTRRAIDAVVADIRNGLHDTYRAFCSSTGRTPRPGQARMISAITTSILEKSHLAVEAPTGTGKGFAYLLPGLVLQRRTLISTSSKVLQNQLIDNDIPAIAAALGRTVEPVLLQGVANYLCHERLAARPDIVTSHLSRWIRTTSSGNRRSAPVDDATWREISTSSESCLGQGCDFVDTCFYQQARRDAQDADIVVVNHDYLVQKLRNSDWITGFDLVVIDEAHDLTEKARTALEVRMSGQQLHRATSAARNAGASTGLVRQLEELGEQFDRSVSQPNTEWLVPLSERLVQLCSRLQSSIDENNHGISAAVRIRANQTIAARGAVAEEFARMRLDWYRYITTTGTGSELVSGPIDAADHLSAMLSAPTVVFTSATLAPLGELTTFRTSVAGEQAATISELQVESPFDFEINVRLYLPGQDEIPNPSEDREGHAAAVDHITRELVEASQGRAIVLTTSTAARDRIAAHLRATTALRIIAQGDGPLLEELISDLKRESKTVLVATRSGWQGIDIPGSAVQLVIMDKIPFPNPTDQAVKAMLDVRGFDLVMKQPAATQIAQGAGRLVRAADDQGVIAMLDPRVARRGLRSAFPSSPQVDLPGAISFLHGLG